MSAADPIRIVIVDDHALVREGIRLALTAPGFEVVGDATSAEEGLALVERLDPDVLVMDISLPGESGIDATARLRRDHPRTHVLMLSVHDHAEYVLESVRAGAHGYLRKDTLPADLRAAVRAVAEGRTAFSAPRPAEVRAPASPVLAAARQRLALLTPRERDVLLGIASGQSNKDIAATLGLGVRTVESYRESLGAKLGISGAAALTRFALEAGLLAS